MRAGEFTLEDFKRLSGQARKLGPLIKIMGMIPRKGRDSHALAEPNVERDVRRLVGIVDAMTPEERRAPRTLGEGHLRRVAKGAGVRPSDVSDLIGQFEAMADIMTKLTRMGSA